MAEESSQNPRSDPPIYKHLNAKTAGILRQVNRHKQEQEEAQEKDNMAATEQT